MTENKYASKHEEFVGKVSAIINSLSLENGCNTPDFVLAEFLWDCLGAFDAASEHKEWLRNSGKIKVYIPEK